MQKTASLVKRLLLTSPLPAFVALDDGLIVAANEALLKVAGQPQLVEMDRSLFGIGVFHNAAELRGFIQSFKNQPGPRRLALPLGRLDSSDRPIILHASRVDWQGRPALYGVLSRHQQENALIVGNGRMAESLLDRFPYPILTVTNEGAVVFVNANLRADLMLGGDGPPRHLLQIDAESDQQTLNRYLKQATLRGIVVYETTLQRGNGTLYPVELTVTPLRQVAVSGQFLITVQDITEVRNTHQRLELLERENAKLATQVQRQSVLVSERYSQREDHYRIVSESEAYRKVLQQVRRVAPTDTTVLLTGETGTGKELLARSIHAQSERRDKPMVILNCGALPAELIESELFGYRKGAFTGARQDHLGRFELADEGTLFLDEIGEMPMQLQTRLLRVLQDGEFTPLGARQSIHTDVRIIAATNRNLRDRVTEGHFRADLYFRLNVFPIYSLPLRERREDIPHLIDHFIEKYIRPGQPLPQVRPSDLRLLQQLPYHGNIRELENLVQRALIVSEGPYLQFEAERLAVAAEAGTAAGPVWATDDLPSTTVVLSFEEAQRQHIMQVLQLTDGKVSGKGGAAELLAMNAQTLFSKMRKLGISRRGEA